MFEKLENRRLMSASLRDGILTIDGTDLDDSISVDQTADKIIVSLRNDDMDIMNPGPEIELAEFDLAEVRRIVIRGRGGNDLIEMDPELELAARISSHGGNDTVLGGKGDDTIHGGRDDDLLIGRYGDDVIYGNAGHDTLNGRHGNDYLHAGAGHDSLRDLDGQNAFNGATGNDIAKLDTGALPIGSGVEQWLRSGGGADNPFQPVDVEDIGAILNLDDVGRLILEFNRGANGDVYTFSRLQRRDDGRFEVIVTLDRGDFGLGPEHFSHRWDVSAAVGSGLIFTTNTPTNLSPGPIQSTALFRPNEPVLGMRRAITDITVDV